MIQKSSDSGLQLQARAQVLLVDDDDSLLQLLAMRLEAAGYTVRTAHSGAEALSRIAEQAPSVVITDMRMPSMDGLELFRRIHTRWNQLPVIMLTAHGTIPDAVMATQSGVFAFLTKPVDKKDLLLAIEKALQFGGGNMPVPEAWARGIITQSMRMHELLQQVRLVAVSEANVLISGASGSGKELLAQAVHRASPRAQAPWIAVNCAAIPQELFESELFGHIKGAFTGAVSDKIGLVRAAEGGTLFLDEIGDMPMAVQAKLLRVLQERRVRPVGEARDFAINIRVIAATHRDLHQEVIEGRFREDLFYRINVVTLHVPALDERKEDIPLLVEHFLTQIAARSGQTKKRFAQEALQLLVTMSWPGNVRELANVVERCAALTPSPLISQETVAQATVRQESAPRSLSDAKKTFERDYLIQTLKLAGGNITLAAMYADRNRSDFHKLLKKHGIDVEMFRFDS